jgi:chromosome segregation ATPase
VGKDLESLRSQLAKVGKEIKHDAAEREKLSMSEANAKEEAMKLKEREKALRTEVQALTSEGGDLDVGRKTLESKRRKLEDDELKHAGRRKRLVETNQARKNAEAGLEKMEEEFTSKRRRLEKFLRLD